MTRIYLMINNYYKPNESMCHYYFIKKGIQRFLLFFIIGWTYSASVIAQERFDLTGVILDSLTQQPLYNVSVVLKGTSIGTATDENGRFALPNFPINGRVEFSLVSYNRKEVWVQQRGELTVHLSNEASTIDEVAVVAYGSQRKSSMVASITTVNPKELKGPTSNLTTMLAGKVAGVIAYQRSGEPGADNASFFIRGVGTFGAGKRDPLILIDGIESTPNDLARLQPDDISGFSVLKDAAASSLYGARGANGVVLVTTKTGAISKAKFNVRYENSLSTNTRNFKFADNVTYMKMANEAVLTRDPKGRLPYSQNKIDH